MKKLTLLALAVAAIGCHHSEFDVTPAQVTQKAKTGHGGVPGGLDLNHLPPGAVKHEQVFKKGDKLPDGTIADADRKIVRIEIPKGAKMPGIPEGATGGRRIIETDDKTVGKP